MSDTHPFSQSYYFDRDDVALPGMHAYFKKASDEEREHAQLFLKYQNKRGGRVLLEDVKRPAQQEWGTAEDAMSAALALERDVNTVRSCGIYDALYDLTT